jgi:hypothetical protein
MKSTFTPSSYQNSKPTSYPVFKIFDDLEVPSNLFNGSIVLFPNANTMVVVHAAKNTTLYKQGKMYVNDRDDLFIPASDDCFHDVKGKLVFEF